MRCYGRLPGSSAAAAKQVSVELSGTHETVSGVPGLLFELAYNLCDNAVKYNVENGAVSRRENRMLLSVEDTGIGIQAERGWDYPLSNTPPPAAMPR